MFQVLLYAAILSIDILLLLSITFIIFIVIDFIVVKKYNKKSIIKEFIKSL